MLWTRRPESILVLAGVLGWCLFVMWGFVFAWSFKHGAIHPLQAPAGGKRWAGLTVGGVIAGILLTLFVDGEYRRLFPTEAPTSLSSWTAGLLFSLALQQLFFCFAPMAFLARLGAGPRTAIGLTVALSLLVLTMKLRRSPVEIATLAIPTFVVARGGLAFAAVVIYRWNGVLAVAWFTLVLHLRHFPALVFGP